MFLVEGSNKGLPFKNLMHFSVYSLPPAHIWLHDMQIRPTAANCVWHRWMNIEFTFFVCYSSARSANVIFLKSAYSHEMVTRRMTSYCQHR